MLTVVAHTDHDGTDVLQRRISKHGNFVLRLVIRVIVDDIRDGVAYTFVACSFCLITCGLRVRQHFQREVEHVIFRPHGLAVGGGVVVIDARLGQNERNLVFVVVVAQVATHTDEARQVAVFEFRVDGTHLLGMNEHLQVLVLPHVIAGILIHRSCVVRTEVHHAQNHRLLVLRNQLSLTRIGLTAHTRWQHIVNRRTGTVLLDVHGLHVDGCACVNRRTDRRQVTRVLSPVAANEVERSKTQVCLFGAARQVHTHEADGLPVADRTYFLHTRAVAAERNLELIPRHLCGLTVSQRHFAYFLLRDVLAAYLHHVGTQDDFILVVFLVFVERIV